MKFFIGFKLGVTHESESNPDRKTDGYNVGDKELGGQNEALTKVDASVCPCLIKKMRTLIPRSIKKNSVTS